MKAMAKVVNNVVKMEWESTRFLQTKATKGQPAVFLFACKEYQTPTGVVPVFFNPYHAWIHYDEDGLFSFKELKDYIIEDQDFTFPETAMEYHPIINAGEDECDMSLIEHFGLQEYVEDIKARLDDIMPYGEEKEVQPAQ